MKCLVVPCAWSDEPPIPSWRGDVPNLCANTRSWYLANGQLDLPMTVANVCRMPNASTDGGSYPILSNAVRNQLAGAGFNIANFDRIVYLTTRNTGVGFKGLCSGKESWINCCGSDYAGFSFIHELGHSFGLAHPFQLYGMGTMQGGVLMLPPIQAGQAQLPAGAQLVEIYDNSTSMGYAATYADFSAPEQAIMGWITPLLYVGGDQTITLAALESAASPGVRGIKIPMTAWLSTSRRVYWLEYRTNTVDANGVQLRVTGDFGCYALAHVNLAFHAGDAISDGTLRIDVLATDANAATVRLRATQQTFALPTLNLTVTPSANLPLGGGQATLNWDAVNTDSVSLEVDNPAVNAPNPPWRPPHDSWPNYYASTTTWTVTAYNIFGRTAKTATITVGPTVPPTTGGNDPMILADYKARVNALTIGQITAAQLAAIDADRAQITVDAGNPPSTDSPERTVINAPNGQITLAGHTWAWGQPGTAAP